MKIVVDIASFSDKDPFKICQPNDISYKKSSRYIGRITQELTTRWQADDFKLMATQGGTEKVTFFFRKNETTRKIGNMLTPDGLKANISIEIEDSKIAETQALLKFLKIPKNAISLA